MRMLLLYLYFCFLICIASYFPTSAERLTTLGIGDQIAMDYDPEPIVAFTVPVRSH